MYSVEFSTIFVEMLLLQTTSVDAPTQLEDRIHVRHMMEVTKRDFHEHNLIPIPITENEVGSVQMMEEV